MLWRRNLSKNKKSQDSFEFLQHLGYITLQNVWRSIHRFYRLYVSNSTSAISIIHIHLLWCIILCVFRKASFPFPCKALEIRYILMDCYLVDIHKLTKAFVRERRIWNFVIKPKSRLTLPLSSFFLIAGWWQLFLVPCKALEIRYILMDCYLVDIHKLMKAFRGYRMWNVVTRPTDGTTIFAY